MTLLKILRDLRFKLRGASLLIKHVVEYYKDSDSIIGEIEDLQYAKTEEDRKLQQRRYNFYMRNGFVDTGVKANVFGAVK